MLQLSGLSQLITYSVQADNAEKNGRRGQQGHLYSKRRVGCSNDAKHRTTPAWGAQALSVVFIRLQEREGFLKPWLILYSILAGIAILVSIIGAIVAFAVAEAVIGAALLITGILLLLIYGYCLVVVYSYYLSLSGIQPGTV
ncbi:Protein of unknown function [Gryllus bimaculatus]|nr:Protein of unknown function [Gryllus bimaculatus]